MIIAGLGFSSKATKEDMCKAIHMAFEQAGAPLSELAGLATSGHKRESVPLRLCAEALGVEVNYIAQKELEQMEALTITRSERSLAATGVPCLSEAAALAAGTGGHLLAARLICGPVSCALVQLGE